MKCKSCGRELRADVKRCPYCGIPVNTDEKRETRAINWKLQEDDTGKNSRNGDDLDIDWGRGRIVDKRTGQVYSRNENKWTEPDEAAGLVFDSSDNEIYQKELDRQVQDIPMDFGIRRRQSRAGMADGLNIGQGFRDAGDKLARSSRKKDIERKDMWNLILDDPADEPAEFPEVEDEQIVLDDELAFIKPEQQEQLKQSGKPEYADSAEETERPAPPLYTAPQYAETDGYEEDELTETDISNLIDNPEYVDLLYGKPDYRDLLNPDDELNKDTVKTEPRELNVEMPGFMRDENKESDIEEVGSINSVERPSIRTLSSLTSENDKLWSDFDNLIHAEDGAERSEGALHSADDEGQEQEAETLELTSEERAKAENAENNSINLSMMPDIKFMSIEDEYERFRQEAEQRRIEREKEREVNIKISEPTGARYTVKTKEVSVPQANVTGRKKTREVEAGELKEGPKSLQVSVEVEDPRGSASVEVTRNQQGSTQVRTVTGMGEHEYTYNSADSVSDSTKQTAEAEAAEEDPLAFWEKRESIPRMTITDIFGPEARDIINGLDKEDGKQPESAEEEKRSFRETMGIPSDELREGIITEAEKSVPEQPEEPVVAEVKEAAPVAEEGESEAAEPELTEAGGTEPEPLETEESDLEPDKPEPVEAEESDLEPDKPESVEAEEPELEPEPLEAEKPELELVEPEPDIGEPEPLEAEEPDAADTEGKTLNLEKTVVIKASDLEKLSQEDVAPDTDVLSAKTIDISNISETPEQETGTAGEKLNNGNDENNGNDGNNGGDLDWTLDLDIDDNADESPELDVSHSETADAPDEADNKYEDMKLELADESELEEDAKALMAELKAATPQIIQVVQPASAEISQAAQTASPDMPETVAVQAPPTQVTYVQQVQSPAAQLNTQPNTEYVQQPAQNAYAEPETVKVQQQVRYVQDDEENALMAELEADISAFNEEDSGSGAASYQDMPLQDDLSDVELPDIDLSDIDPGTEFIDDFNEPETEFKIDDSEEQSSVRTDTGNPDGGSQSGAEADPAETEDTEEIDIDSLPPAERKAALKRRKEAEKEKKKLARQQAANFNFDSNGTLAKIVRVILILLIIAVLIEFTVIGIKLFAPDSEAALFIEKLEEVVPFLKTDNDMLKELDMSVITADSTDAELDSLIERTLASNGISTEAMEGVKLE